MARERFDLVLTDLSMKGTDGLQVLEAVRKHQPDTLAIMLTGYASLDSAVEAIRRGVEASEIQVFDWGSFTFFADPDGNRWAVQQLPPR